MSIEAVDPLDVPEVKTAAAEEETSKLQKHFGRADIFFFLVCTLVGIDGLGSLATSGGEGFTWLLICVLLFAVPSALLLAEAGRAYTGEGGPYVWVRMAFGHLAGAINNFFYWVTNPVWMGGTLVGTAIGGLVTFFNDGEDYSTTFKYVFAAVFIWAGVLFAILSFKIGKWVATIGAIARFLLLGLFSIVVVVYGVENGFHGPDVGTYMPSDQRLRRAGAADPVQPGRFRAAQRRRRGDGGPGPGRAAGHHQVGGGDRAALRHPGVGHPGGAAHGPDDRPGRFPGRAQAGADRVRRDRGDRRRRHRDLHPDRVQHGHRLGDGDPGGRLVAFTSGLTWIMGSDRTLAVSCYDGAGPRSLGKFSARFGTPLRVNVLSGIISSVIFVLATEITEGDAYKFFTVALNLAISTTLISYLGIFPAAWRLRRRNPHHPLPFKAPWLRVMTVISVLWIVFCTIQILFPGLGDSWFSGEYLPENWTEDERWVYLFTELVPLVAFTAIAVVFWMIGRREQATSQRELATLDTGGLPEDEPRK